MKLSDLLPVRQPNVHMPLREMLYSMLAAFFAILLLALEIRLLAAHAGLGVLLLASMGASACLMFALPHSPLAQPWPMFGGHLVSVVVGVACAQWIAYPPAAVAAAVALAIAGMFFLRCLHPPSAGTAMIAAIGGQAISPLGWQFVPIVALNAGTLLLLALAINNMVPGRRYPMRHTHHPHHQQFAQPADLPCPALKEEDFGWALDQMDGVIAVTEEDLVDLYEFAVEHARKRAQG